MNFDAPRINTAHTTQYTPHQITQLPNVAIVLIFISSIRLLYLDKYGLFEALRGTLRRY